MRTKPCLTSADAHKMMAAAEKNNWKVSIAIVDDAGVMLLLERMDGAGPTTPEVARGNHLVRVTQSGERAIQKALA